MLDEIIDRKNISRLRRLIDDAEKVVITAHVGPDGDAIGSSLGLAHVLSEMGKDVKVVVPDDFPRLLAFLPGAKEIVVYCKYTPFACELLKEADLIFCLDYNDLKRVDRMAPAVESATCPKVMIDHHLDPSDHCQLVISHPEMSSTCMLLFRVLCSLELFDIIDRNAATCLMAGMMTDTGNFSYNANDPDIYNIIALLLQKGVDRDDLSRRLFDTQSENAMRLNAYAISRKMEVFKDAGAALITLSRDELNRFHYSKGDTEGLVNRPLAIPQVIYSTFLREEERYIKVSMRSKGDFPCDKICARYFGGGGHRNAAGGEFRGSLEQAAEVLRSILEENKRLYIPDSQKKK